MALTLAQAKALSDSKLTNQIIDEFRKSPLLDALTFDNTVKVQGGKTLAYVYNRITTQPTAGTRAINGEYVAQETVTTQNTVNLKVMGGAYELDRVIANDEKQVVDQIEFQTTQKAKATVAVFNDLFINGNSTVTATEFDGIDKAVTGSTTERNADSFINLSDSSNIDSNYKNFLYQIRKLEASMDGKPTHYLMNGDLFAVFQTIADRVPNIHYVKNELGEEVLKYGNALLVEMGDKAGSSDPIIGNVGKSVGTGTGSYSLTTDTDINPAKIYYTRSGSSPNYTYTKVTTPAKADIATYYEQAGEYVTGLTDLYAVRLGMDGVHGVSPDGDTLIKHYYPDFKTAGAVKKGEVEFVGAIAIKATKSVGAIRNIKVA